MGIAERERKKIDFDAAKGIIQSWIWAAAGDFWFRSWQIKVIKLQSHSFLKKKLE